MDDLDFLITLPEYLKKTSYNALFYSFSYKFPKYIFFATYIKLVLIFLIDTAEPKLPLPINSIS